MGLTRTSFDQLSCLAGGVPQLSIANDNFATGLAPKSRCLAPSSFVSGETIAALVPQSEANHTTLDKLSSDRGWNKFEALFNPPNEKHMQELRTLIRNSRDCVSDSQSYMEMMKRSQGGRGKQAKQEGEAVEEAQKVSLPTQPHPQVELTEQEKYYLDSAAEATKHFLIGDKVRWSMSDEDIPEGAIGEVVKISNEPGFIEVKYDSGVWDLFAVNLSNDPSAIMLNTGDEVHWAWADEDIPKDEVGQVLAHEGDNWVLTRWANGEWSFPAWELIKVEGGHSIEDPHLQDPGWNDHHGFPTEQDMTIKEKGTHLQEGQPEHVRVRPEATHEEHLEAIHDESVRQTGEGGGGNAAQEQAQAGADGTAVLDTNTTTTTTTTPTQEKGQDQAGKASGTEGQQQAGQSQVTEPIKQAASFLQCALAALAPSTEKVAMGRQQQQQRQRLEQRQRQRQQQHWQFLQTHFQESGRSG